jgi:hypothetical protein
MINGNIISGSTWTRSSSRPAPVNRTVGKGTSRQARIGLPDALHYIMVRGIERREIFRDNKDKDNSCIKWDLL